MAPRRPPTPLDVGIRPPKRRPGQPFGGTRAAPAASERPARGERPERPARPERSERTERPDRNERPARRESNARPTRDVAEERPPSTGGFSVRLEDEQKLCGLNACRAVFGKRPQDIVKVYLAQTMVKELGAMLQWCAQNKRAYKIIPEEELRKVSESTHHEGVCVVVRRQQPRTLEMLLAEVRKEPGPRCILALENVENPHNLGAILRVAAHFGVRDVLCLGNTPVALSAALARTAEGAAEHARLVAAPDAPAAVKALQDEGFSCLATSHRGPVVLYSALLDERTVWMLGSEGEGLSASLMHAADGVVAIPGSGNVESLNVACAATALLGEWWRQHRAS